MTKCTLLLDRSKLGLIHQEICCLSMSSVCIKRHENWSNKQVKKSCSLSLNRWLLLKLNMKLRSSINGSTHPRFIKNYNFRISRSEIQPRLMYLFRVSFLTALDIYKPYFKSRHTRIQRLRDLFSLWEATAFVRHRVL